MRIWGVIAFALLVCSAPQAAETALHKAQGAAVVLGFNDGTCSGTVVGPHLILTATHCFANNAQLARVNGAAVVVGSVIADQSDHTLVVVSATFQHIVRVGKAAEQGDDVFILGAPGPFPTMLRRGYVAGEVAGQTEYTMSIYYGDSGAAIFNDSGEVVAVLSGELHATQGGMAIGFAFSWPFTFTQAQLAAVTQ